MGLKVLTSTPFSMQLPASSGKATNKNPKKLPKFFDGGFPRLSCFFSCGKRSSTSNNLVFGNSCTKSGSPRCCLKIQRCPTQVVASEKRLNKYYTSKECNPWLHWTIQECAKYPTCMKQVWAAVTVAVDKGARSIATFKWLLKASQINSSSSFKDAKRCF